MYMIQSYGQLHRMIDFLIALCCHETVATDVRWGCAAVPDALRPVSCVSVCFL